MLLADTTCIAFITEESVQLSSTEVKVNFRDITTDSALTAAIPKRSLKLRIVLIHIIATTNLKSCWVNMELRGEELR